MSKELSILEQSLLENINKKFGKDNPMVRLSDSDYGEPRGWVDTGILALNWLISGKFDGGYPVGRITELDGDPGTGKSLLCQMAMADPTNELIIYFDTEAALSKDFMTFLGVDPSKVLYEPIDTIEQITEISQEVLNTIIMNKQTNKKVLMIIDSIALASTEKEMDPEKGCYVGDTIVHTENGEKNIKDLKIGDKVLTHLSKFKEIEQLHVFDNKEKPELIELELETGEIIKLTPSHKVLIHSVDGPKWVEANALKETDQVLKLNI